MKAFILRLFRSYSRDKIRIYSSSAAFYIVVSALPLIAILIFSLTHVSLDLVKELEALLEEILPSEVFRELNIVISSLSEKGVYAYVPFSIIAAIWGSTKGIGGLCHGIESIYGVKGTERFILRSIKALWRTLVFYAIIITSLLAFAISKLIYVKSPIALIFARGRVVISAILLSIALALFFAKISGTRFKKQMPGGIFSSVCCMLFTFFYSIYITYALKTQSIYAEMGTLIFFMLWAYFCVNIILIGAEIGKALPENKKKKF